MAENFSRSSGGEDELSGGAPDWLENFFDTDGEKDSSTEKKSKRFRKLFKPLFRTVYPRAEQSDASPKNSESLNILSIIMPGVKNEIPKNNNIVSSEAIDEAHTLSKKEPAQESFPATKNENEAVRVGGIESTIYERDPQDVRAETDSFKNNSVGSAVDNMQGDLSVGFDLPQNNIEDTDVQNENRLDPPIDKANNESISGGDRRSSKSKGVVGFLASEMLARRRDRKIKKQIDSNSNQFKKAQENTVRTEQKTEKSLKRLIRRVRKTKRTLKDTVATTASLEARLNNIQKEKTQLDSKLKRPEVKLDDSRNEAVSIAEIIEKKREHIYNKRKFTDNKSILPTKEEARPRNFSVNNDREKILKKDTQKQQERIDREQKYRQQQIEKEIIDSKKQLREIERRQKQLDNNQENVDRNIQIESDLKAKNFEIDPVAQKMSEQKNSESYATKDRSGSGYIRSDFSSAPPKVKRGQDYGYAQSSPKVYSSAKPGIATVFVGVILAIVIIVYIVVGS